MELKLSNFLSSEENYVKFLNKIRDNETAMYCLLTSGKPHTLVMSLLTEISFNNVLLRQIFSYGDAESTKLLDTINLNGTSEAFRNIHRLIADDIEEKHITYESEHVVMLSTLQEIIASKGKPYKAKFTKTIDDGDLRNYLSRVEKEHLRIVIMIANGNVVIESNIPQLMPTKIGEVSDRSFTAYQYGVRDNIINKLNDIESFAIAQAPTMTRFIINHHAKGMYTSLGQYVTLGKKNYVQVRNIFKRYGWWY